MAELKFIGDRIETHDIISYKRTHNPGANKYSLTNDNILYVPNNLNEFLKINLNELEKLNRSLKINLDKIRNFKIVSNSSLMNANRENSNTKFINSFNNLNYKHKIGCSDIKLNF